MSAGKLNIFAVVILSLLLCAAVQAESVGGGLGPEPPWGKGLRELKRLHPGLLRSHGGLDSRARTRIQRFRDFGIHFGVRTEILYDFIGRRLFQVEYNFQQPNDLTFKLASSELVARYGAPLGSSNGGLPSGELFEERSLADLTWKRNGLEICLRQIFSRFVNGTVVRQMFVTMRSADVLHSDSRPLQLQSDAEIEKAGKRLRIAFAGGIDPQRIAGDTSFEGVRRVLENADIAVATLDGTLAEAHGNSPEGPLFAVNEAALAQLKASGIDVVNMASHGAVAAGADAALVGADALHHAGLEFVGFGRTRRQAFEGLVVEDRGVRVAFLAFAYAGYNKDCKQPEPADAADAPTFSASCASAGQFRREVAAAVTAASEVSDVVAVLFAWNSAGSACSSLDQNMLIDAAWNAGADIVTGYRRGVLQPLRGAPGKVALTSCGDLLFDTRPDSTQGAGIIFEVEVNSAGLVSYDFGPLVRTDSGTQEKAAGPKARRIMDELRAVEQRCNSENKGSNRE